VSWPLILTGDFAAAESYLNQVERSPDLPPDLQVGLLVARAFIARARGDYQRTIALSRRALAHLPPHTLDPRCIVAVNLGIAYWNVGRLSEAEEALIEAEATAHRVGNHHARLTARGFLALIQGARGRLHRAAEMCQETIGLGEHLPATALARTALAALHYEWDEMDAAAEQAERSIELSRRSGNPEVQTVGYRVLARIRQAQGKREAAVAALDEADRLAAEEDPGSIMRVRNAAARVCVALFEGDLATAERWIAQVTDDQAPFLLYPHLGLLRTHLDLARGRRSAAARALVDWHRRVEAAGWCYGVVEVCSLQALTAPDEATALPFLVEALELAAPEGYVRTFIDKGAAMAQLLRAAVARGVAADYAHRLLRAFAPAPPAGVDSTLIELLSPRELEVLQLLPTGRTNQEIANVLFLSVNTVKTHLKNVYAKLGVGDRRQAVRRARDLGLIPK
jgi:LuxR family maltose regulon positive regulatory protein